jgi:hypothetical protein
VLAKLGLPWRNFIQVEKQVLCHLRRANTQLQRGQTAISRLPANAREGRGASRPLVYVRLPCTNIAVDKQHHTPMSPTVRRLAFTVMLNLSFVATRHSGSGLFGLVPQQWGGQPCLVSQEH